MEYEPKQGVQRRGFLKGAAVGGLTAAVAPLTTVAQQNDAGSNTTAVREGPRNVGATPPNVETTDRPEGVVLASGGSDYMVDVIRALGIEYFAATPGNTFMGLHESVVNYGMTTAPNLRFITTMHEEASVAMAHGYAKIEGKPMACAFHATVGTQHAAMAIYNAYCDRVPIFMMTGAGIEADKRKSTVEWSHTVVDGPGMVRDFTKWDDTPGNLTGFGESAARAWRFAMTPPYGPVLLAVDVPMQEDEIPGGEAGRPPVPKLPSIHPPSADANTVREIARLLVNAEHPVISVDRCARTPAGLQMTVELAELLAAPVSDSGNRMGFPWRHPLNQGRRFGELRRQADVLLALEPGNPFGLVTSGNPDGTLRRALGDKATSITISSADLYPKGNYQNLQRYADMVDMAIQADAQATLPFLIEEVKRLLPASRSKYEARARAFADNHKQDFEASLDAARYGWDATPISMPRLAMEMYEVMKTEDWSLLSHHYWQSSWSQRLWDADKHHQFIGGSGADGVGYTSPASLGAALANQKYGRLSVAVVGDGDLMFGPGTLWTAAHEQIPILYIVHNNRAYHQEIMQMQAISNRRQRGVDRAAIGCVITDPDINYAMLARSMGVYSEGPIENPRDLGPALRRAVAQVRKGEPALIDVVSQGR
ncbi:MAG: twin-arginine translocation signal domain-containing protein [Gammaproteobacteria bacterium]|nr:twin-arginine translocation signal domain-containing protein [Gammaproteobacteria bacterium]